MKKQLGFVLLICILLGMLIYPYYQMLAAKLALIGVPYEREEPEEESRAENIGSRTSQESRDPNIKIEEPQENGERTGSGEKEILSGESGSTREEPPTPPRVSNSLAACLFDADSRRVLFQKNGYTQLPMASTTKIMTCLVVLEETKPDEIVTVSKYASTMPDVQLGIREGEQYYVKDLLYSLMLESHNDTAVALAEHVSGSEEAFCERMTARAKALGATNTSFQTPNGLDKEAHYTTAADLALITSEAIKNEAFLTIIGTQSHNFKEISKGTAYCVNNKNRFLTMMQGAFGVKTGFTGKAGYCFVGALEQEGKTLISVVLGCGWPPNKNLKWTDTKALMEYGLSEYEKINLTETGIEFPDVLVSGGICSEVSVSCEEANEAFYVLMRPDETVHTEVQIEKQVTAPVVLGQTVGYVDYYIEEEIFATFPIKTTEKVRKIEFADCIRWAIRVFLSGGESEERE